MQVLFAPFCKIYCEICIWCVFKLHNMHFFTLFAAFCPPRRRFGASLNAASCKYRHVPHMGGPGADWPRPCRTPSSPARAPSARQSDARKSVGFSAGAAWGRRPESPLTHPPACRPQTASGPFHPERPRSIRRAHCMPIMFMTPAATPMTAATMPSIQKAR